MSFIPPFPIYVVELLTIQWYNENSKLEFGGENYERKYRDEIDF